MEIADVLGSAEKIEMPLLPDDVLQIARNSVLCWLATCRNSGQPNVSPKEVFALEPDGRLLIANIASPRSARNVCANANVCVALLDIFRQKGVKLYGIARLVKADSEEFADLLKFFDVSITGKFPIRSIFSIDVTEYALILAPSYRLDPPASETSQVEEAAARYDEALRHARSAANAELTSHGRCG